MAQPDPRSSLFETLRKLLRFSNTSTPSNRFQDSFGAQISDFHGQSRWAVAGTAAQVWHHTIQPLIDDLVLQNENQIYKNWKIRDTTAIRHCWMIGTDREHAYPTIVICCDARPILKRMMRMLLEDETIKREGFKVLGVPTRDLRLTATPSKQGDLIDPSSSKPRSLCGTRIIADNTGKEATIGGAIIVDGNYYALTVAHVFSPDDVIASDPSTEPDELVVYGSDWALQSDSDDDESQDGLEESEEYMGENHISLESSLTTPNMSNNGIGQLNLSCQAPHTAQISFTSQSKAEQLSVSYISPAPADTEFEFDGFDWAMMKLDRPTMNYVSEFHSQAFKREPPSGRVLLCSSNKRIYGSGSGSSCSIKFRGSNVSQNVWSVSFDQNPGPGSSGAWVVDAVDGDIYGVLFACSVSLNEGYIIPFHVVLDNIADVTRASTISLPSLEEPCQVPHDLECEASCKDTRLHFIPRDSITDSNQSSKNQPSQGFSSEHHKASWKEVAAWDYFDDLPPITTAPQALSTLDVCSLMLNKMIGTGIFVAPPAVLLLVEMKGLAALIWIVGFMFTLASSYSMMFYIEFAHIAPRSGGELCYLDEITSGSRPKFMRWTHGLFKPVWRSGLFSYTLFTAFFLVVGNSGTSSLQFARSVLVASMPQEQLVPDENSVRILAATTVLIACLLTSLSSSLGRKLNQVAAVAKIMLLIGIISTGLYLCCATNGTPSLPIVPESPRWVNVPAAFLLVLFSFQGWENALFVAGEVGPKRLSVLRQQSWKIISVVGVLYLCINVVFLYLTPSSIAGANIYLIDSGSTGILTSKSPFAAEINYHNIFIPKNGSWLDGIWVMLISLSALGSMQATLYTFSKVAHEMVKTNILPWSRLWKRISWNESSYSPYTTQVPTGGLILYLITSCGVIGISTIFSGSFETSSSLNYISTFIQSLLIVILTFDLWRRKSSSTATRSWKYLNNVFFGIYISFTIYLIIGSAIPNTSPAAVSFAGWKLLLITSSILAIATIYYLLVFASARTYDVSRGRWLKPGFWRWSVLGLARVKCEILVDDGSSQDMDFLPLVSIHSKANFVNLDQKDRSHDNFLYWLFGGRVLKSPVKKLLEFLMWGLESIRIWCLECLYLESSG